MAAHEMAVAMCVVIAVYNSISVCALLCEVIRLSCLHGLIDIDCVSTSSAVLAATGSVAWGTFKLYFHYKAHLSIKFQASMATCSLKTRPQRKLAAWGILFVLANFP